MEKGSLISVTARFHVETKIVYLTLHINHVGNRKAKSSHNRKKCLNHGDKINVVVKTDFSCENVNFSVVSCLLLSIHFSHICQYLILHNLM